ncbi:MAG TPA: CDP-alcohol phosphatidyltransferase family protein [Candidatus Saccharimonadales bacterium]
MKKETLFLAATAGRLVQGRSLWKNIAEGKSIKGIMATILISDQTDGMGAKFFGADGPKRRALDSAVDATLIATGLVALWRERPRSRPYVAALAAREVFVGAGWAADLAKSKQVKQGDFFQKTASGSIAAFALAATSESSMALKIFGSAAVAVNGVLAYDYYKGWTQPERNVMLDTGVAEVQGFYDARRAIGSLRYDGPPQLSAGDGTGTVLELMPPAEPLTPRSL